MDKKIKGLFIADAVAATGFARVAHSIIDNLPKKYEIAQLGINYFGDPHPYKHEIYPASLGGDVYGLGRLVPLIMNIKPDFIFIINDPWVISMYLQELQKQKIKDIPPIIVYFPVDAREHSPSFYAQFDLVKKVCVYTQFGKEVILATQSPNITEEKIHIVPHGISTKTFYPINSTFAKQTLYPKDRTEEFLDSFIIFNGNRNQPRKRIDITMWAFREFQKNKPDVKLYLHMGVLDMGVNIAELAARYGFDNKLILSTMENRIPSVPDEKLNIIYNATDVGINTSLGEGWGLVNWEHAATGKPQILPSHSALKEIWEGSAKLIPTIMPQMIERVNTVGMVPDVRALVSMLEWAYNDWKYNGGIELNALGQKGYALTQEERFTWQSVAKEFDKVITEMLKEE
jgi:glycosyltransferase involved in cell wall biosynthesis